MSASNEWAEWHLTPRGWERGDFQLDAGRAQKGRIPSDRVMTCTYREYLSSAFSSLDRTVREEWRDADNSLADHLLARYGPCPETFFPARE